MRNLFFVWDRVLGARDSRKIANNTRLHRTWNDAIELRHWGTALFTATATQVTIRPYKSISSSRRLEFLAEAGHWIGRTRDRDFTYRAAHDPSTVTMFVQYIVVNHEGTVLETDWVEPKPWEDRRKRIAVIRAAVKSSYAVWVKRPVMGCACCKSYALNLITHPATAQALWEQYSRQEVPVCFWHTARVAHQDTLLAAWRDCLAELPTATRSKALRQRVVRERFTQAAIETLDAQLEHA